MTDQFLQQSNRRSQLCDGLLQSSYSILARLEGSLLETREGLEIYHLVFQEKDLLRTTINTVMCCLLLLVEDDIVLLDGVLNHIGHCQHLLTMLLGVGLNTTDLCHMGSPLHLSIIHLQDVLEGHQLSFNHSRHLGFKLHYPG